MIELEDPADVKPETEGDARLVMKKRIMLAESGLEMEMLKII